MPGFEYNRQHSSNFDIIVQSVNRPILPAKRRREVSVPGRAGSYDFGSNKYENRMITVDISFIAVTFVALRLNARDIELWLRQTTYCELIFDDEPDKYYAAKIYNEIGLENFFRFGKASLVFECQPMAQAIETTDEDTTILDSYILLDSDELLNPIIDYTVYMASGDSTVEATIDFEGNIELGLGAQDGAQFNIVVTGTFTEFSITMNGKTLTYTENCVAQTIVIDNLNATVKNGTTNKMDKVTGDTLDFLKLIPGDNVIDISKTGDEVAFTFDFRPQYI